MVALWTSLPCKHRVCYWLKSVRILIQFFNFNSSAFIFTKNSHFIKTSTIDTITLILCTTKEAEAYKRNKNIKAFAKKIEGGVFLIPWPWLTKGGTRGMPNNIGCFLRSRRVWRDRNAALREIFRRFEEFKLCQIEKSNNKTIIILKTSYQQSNWQLPTRKFKAPHIISPSLIRLSYVANP